MELYIIRHAQSTNNALDDPRNRVCDPPLTELGERQAEIVAQHLVTGTRLAPWEQGVDNGNERGYGITRLYCSPMWRALQTAQYVGQALELAPQVWIDIHERGGIFLDHGDAGGIVGYPGKTRSEILAEFPDCVLPEGITAHGWWRQEGWEDKSAFYGRVAKVVRELRQWAANDERIAVVSHGAFVDSLLKALFNQLPGHGISYHHLNTAISQINFRSDGYLDIEYLNRASHLPLELVS